MKDCIKTFIANCKICLKHSPLQARTPVTGTAPSTAISPMNSLGVDLFDANGKKWLAVVCCYSGYAWLSLLHKTALLHIIETLNSLFLEYGFPNNIRSDGGPQFCSEFAEFFKAKDIKHELCSPYNPESNGLAKSGGKKYQGPGHQMRWNKGRLEAGNCKLEEHGQNRRQFPSTDVLWSNTEAKSSHAESQRQAILSRLLDHKKGQAASAAYSFKRSTFRHNRRPCPWPKSDDTRLHHRPLVWISKHTREKGRQPLILGKRWSRSHIH